VASSVALAAAMSRPRDAQRGTSGSRSSRKLTDVDASDRLVQHSGMVSKRASRRVDPVAAERRRILSELRQKRRFWHQKSRESRTAAAGIAMVVVRTLDDVITIVEG